jgi:hypothetical protein
MHVHAEKGDAECKYWLHPDRFDITEEFEYNCTPRLRREVRQIVFEHFDQNASEGIVQSRTKPVLAKAIETTPEALIDDYGNRACLDSVGKLFRVPRPRLSRGTQPGGTLAFRIWHPLAVD